MVTENGIHLPPMKVISNTILFVYSLRGALNQNCAHVSHAMAQSFRWNQPHFLPPKQTFLGVRHAFLSYSCRAGTRDANVCVERLSHFLKRSEGILLRSPSPIIANISHLRSCFDSWACPNHILRSHKLIWVSALTFLMCWFHYSVEILVTVRSNIYYLSHS